MVVQYLARLHVEHVDLLPIAARFRPRIGQNRPSSRGLNVDIAIVPSFDHVFGSTSTRPSALYESATYSTG